MMKNRITAILLSVLMVILLLPLMAMVPESGTLEFNISQNDRIGADGRTIEYDNGYILSVNYDGIGDNTISTVNGHTELRGIPGRTEVTFTLTVPEGESAIPDLMLSNAREQFDQSNTFSKSLIFSEDQDIITVSLDFGSGGGNENARVVKLQINNNDGANGSVLCKFETEQEFTAYTAADKDGSGNIMLEIPEGAGAVTFKTEPDEGFSLQDCTILCDDQDIDESKAYRNSVEGDGYEYSLPDDDKTIVFRADFGEAMLSWHTVSWGGGNVTVENGRVIPYAIHVGDTTYNAPFTELTAPDALKEKHVTYSNGDLFIADGTTDAVSIDFRFIPDYGYQVTDVRATEDSLLDQFAPGEEISTFSFEYKGGNVHFIVEFSPTNDIINSEGSIVTSASIDNGENAIGSGNLKMDIADVEPDEVSAGLIGEVGENEAQYLDMKLSQVVSKGGENGSWENRLTELDGSINVSLTVPELDPDAEYYIIREHTNEDGSSIYDEISVEYDPEASAVSFATDKFSTYALVKADASANRDITVDTSYTLTFDMNGHGTQIAAQTVEEGRAAVKPADPKASGYTFNGWYADVGLSAKFDFSTPITANTTLYAKWTKDAAAPTDATSPQTGDNTNILLMTALLFVSCGVLATTVVYGVKRK